MSWVPTIPRKVAYGLGLVTLAVVVGLGLRSAPASANGETGALAVETRLLAPCCWNGTLDTHESELARSLRSEIETRVAHGETGKSIEDDLLGRYGSKIRALPHENALEVMLGAAAVLVLGAGVLLFARVRRWRGAGEAEQTCRASGATRSAPVADDYDARIDAELAELD